MKVVPEEGGASSRINGVSWLGEDSGSTLFNIG